MRKGILRSMVLVLTITLLLFYAILAVILYQRNLTLLEEEVRQEARYIQTAVNISGSEYLAEMNEVDLSTRVTQVDRDGEVLYDTMRDESELEDHSQRNEVQEAFERGEGEDVRMSDTLGTEMYYYAILLDDGTVLRVSRSMDSLMHTAVNVLPVIGALAVLMIVVAYFLAKWQTRKLIHPIINMDLEHPLDNVGRIKRRKLCPT